MAMWFVAGGHVLGGAQCANDFSRPRVYLAGLSERHNLETIRTTVPYTRITPHTPISTTLESGQNGRPFTASLTTGSQGPSVGVVSIW